MMTIQVNGKSVYFSCIFDETCIDDLTCFTERICTATYGINVDQTKTITISASAERKSDSKTITLKCSQPNPQCQITRISSFSVYSTDSACGKVNFALVLKVLIQIVKETKLKNL